MKRFWTIFCRSLGALIFSVSTGLASECSNDPNECTPKNLCAAATSQKDGNTIWSDASSASKHVSFAKDLGINCGVVEIVDPCDTDANECKISQLCEKATLEVDGVKSWSEEADAYVGLAKDYGLSCEVNEKRHCNRHLDKCTPDQLCARATYTPLTLNKKVWQSSDKKFVQEAKRRGLDCGVTADAKEAVIALKTSDVCTHAEFKGCNALELCERATWGKNATFWYSDTNNFVIEAKRRGLSCDVEKKATAPKAKTTSAIVLEASKRTCPSSGIWDNCTNTYVNKNGNKWIGRRINNDPYGTITYLSLEEDQWKGDVRIGQRKNDKWYGPNLYVWRGGNARFDLEVPKGTYNSNSTVNEVLPELKRMFNALSRQERLTAQRSMAKKGLYSSTIDGAWGRNTLIGLGRFSAEHLNTINLTSKRNIQLVLDGLLAQVSRSKTKMAPLAILEKVAERDAGFVKVASSSSIMKNAFIKESLLKRKQIQYALKQLGYYRSGIDGLWGNGTSSALTSFQSEEGLLSSSSSQVFRRILSEVSVPTSFAAPKKIITRNDPPKKSAQGYTKAQAEAICEPQAKLAGRQATSAYRPRNQSIDCFDYGSIMSCSQGSSGGFWGGMLEGMEKSSARKQAYNAVKDSCMAQYGWY